MAYPRGISHREHLGARGVGDWLVFRVGLSRLLLGSFVLGLAVPPWAPSSGRIPLLAACVGLTFAVSLALWAWAGREAHFREKGAQYVDSGFGGVGESGEINEDGVAGRKHLRTTLSAIATMVPAIFLCAGLAVSEARLISLAQSPLANLVGGQRFVAAELVLLEDPRLGKDGVLRAAALAMRAWTQEPKSEAETRPGPEAASGAHATGGVGADGLLLEVEGHRAGPGTEGALQRGDIVRAEGRFLALTDPAVREERGEDYCRFLEHEALHAFLRVSAGSIDVVGVRGGFAGVVDRVRSAALSHLSEGIDPRFGGLLRGIVLGDKRGINEETLVEFRRSGLSHALATSGLHVGSLAGVVLTALLGCGLRRRTALFFSLLVIAGFACLAGLGVSIVRASVMATFVVLAGCLGRGRDKWTALFLAAIVVLAANPYEVMGAGFQLSFAAVCGLFVLARPLETALLRVRFLPASVVALLSVSGAATVATTPVALLTFGDASLFGVLANLLVVPLLPLVMSLGFASLLDGFALPLASGLLNKVGAILVGWITQIADVFARFPTVAETGVGRVLAVLVGGALGAVVCVRVRSRRRVAWVVLGAALGLALFAGAGAIKNGLLHAAAARSWPADVEVRVLDVGQGSAALIRTPGGRAVLVDGGPADCGLFEQLQRLGVEELDVVVVSHPHADHFAGLQTCVGRIPIGLLVDGFPAGPAPPVGDSPDEGDVSSFLRFRDSLRECGTGVRSATEVSALAVDGVDIAVANAERSARTLDRSGGPGRTLSGEELNAASLVVTVSSSGVAILLPGDAEADVLAELELGQSAVLVVSHHGSAGAVSGRLLERLSSTVAVVSVGEGNSFGHPHETTLRALAERVRCVLRTDHVGWVALTCTALGLEVRTERAPPPGGDVPGHWP